MTIPDLINGLFETGGGISSIFNCLALYKDKAVKGIYIPTVIFFTSWSFWNLYFYPHLHQWASFVGGLTIVVTNSTWVIMALYYTYNKHVS